MNINVDAEKEREIMTTRGIPDVIGITALGRPIITSTGCCAYFERQNSALACTRECWYCKYADFRENTALQKRYGICRRERGKSSPMLSEDDLDEVVGGLVSESGQMGYNTNDGYKCQCGAIFCCQITECPICHNTNIQKT